MFLAGFRSRRRGADQELRRVRDELGDRRAVHGARGRDGRVEAGGGHDGRRHPEVVVDGETGFLVPPQDPKAMAERIVQLLKDDALRGRMGEAGLARARARFTVERMVEETNAVYERAVGTRREAGTARRAARG